VRPRGIALVTLAAVAIGVTYADHAPLIPLLSADLGLDDLRAGLLSTALFGVSVITALTTSGLADRFGPKRLVGAALALSVAGSALFGLAPGYGGLLLAKAVDGFASALGFVAGARYVAGMYRDDRSHFGLGLYGAGYPLGSAAALLVMPTLGVAFGWRGAFAFSGAFVAATLALWYLAPSVPTITRSAGMPSALRCANCWWTSLQHAAGFGLAIASGTWITVYLLREFALPLELSGVLGSSLLLLAVVARPVGGVLVARRLLPTRVVMRLADFLVIAGVALLALPGRPLALALAGALVLGLGVGLPYAPVFNTAAASLPRAPAAAQGLAAVGGTAGVMVGAPVMGFAVQTWGFVAAWAFVGAVAAAALAGTLVMRGEEELATNAAAERALDPRQRSGDIRKR